MERPLPVSAGTVELRKKQDRDSPEVFHRLSSNRGFSEAGLPDTGHCHPQGGVGTLLRLETNE